MCVSSFHKVIPLEGFNASLAFLLVHSLKSWGAREDGREHPKMYGSKVQHIYRGVLSMGFLKLCPVVRRREIYFAVERKP